MPTKIKNGYVTSEFATVIAQIVFNFALAAGWVDTSQMDQMVQQIALVISSLVTAAMAIAYIKGRMDLKKTTIIMDVKKQDSAPALLK